MAVYFDEPGPANLWRTLDLAGKRAEELGIKDILVATTTGATGVAAAEKFRGYNLVAVTHSTGFSQKDVQELLPENRRRLEEMGVKILTCQHALGGVNRAVRHKLKTYQMDEIIAYTLRTMGQGFKVCLEIALMAADAGLISTQEPCIAIGGTSTGADTALLLRPSNAQAFFETRIQEIIAKPLLSG